VPPRAILLDYGGTLVEEAAFDMRAGVELLLANLANRPPLLRFEDVLERVARIERDVSARRDVVQMEAPWPAVTRLIYDFFGVRFARPLSELELAFWDATATTLPMPGVRAALGALRELGIPLGVVSNSSFRGEVIRHELATHDLADPISVVVTSADYIVRKPNPLLFELAASCLGTPPPDIWFIGDRLDTDVAGARAAGMTAVLLDIVGNARPDDADLVVSSWQELVAEVVEARR
jgi:putative hydrolase of the HAD superfamily